MSKHVTVVGGSYGEECSFPRSVIFRGSGLRAAMVLNGLSHDVTLETVAGPKLLDQVSDIAKQNKISVNIQMASADIWFRYRHPLSKPDIYPPNIPTFGNTHFVDAENALVFGMLEGRPRVSARKAVYDPQDGFRAKSFESNGSTARELAIVASLSEGRAITNEEAPDAIASELLRSRHCQVVVLKCGPQGALVKTPSMHAWIQAFPTSRVWKIGSGDVFSAAFAHKWLLNGTSPIEAAWFASRVVAEYVATRKEHFSVSKLDEMEAEATHAQESSTGHPRVIPTGSIYLAGPFFTTSQQWLVDEARFALRELGFSVFSPIHEIGEGPPDVVAPADLPALEEASLVYALIDGLDSGTLFEVGYARARGIPVVCLAESEEARSLTMLLGSGCAVLTDFTGSIYNACWNLTAYA